MTAGRTSYSNNLILADRETRPEKVGNSETKMVFLGTYQDQSEAQKVPGEF